MYLPAERLFNVQLPLEIRECGRLTAHIRRRGFGLNVNAPAGECFSGVEFSVAVFVVENFAADQCFWVMRKFLPVWFWPLPIVIVVLEAVVAR